MAYIPEFAINGAARKGQRGEMLFRIFFNAPGIGEVFFAIRRRSTGWSFTRAPDGAVIYAGRLFFSVSQNAAHRKVRRAALAFVAIDACFTLAGHGPWLTADPLELATWAIVAWKFAGC